MNEGCRSSRPVPAEAGVAAGVGAPCTVGATAMTEHTKTDGLPGIEMPVIPQVLERSRPRNDRMAGATRSNATPARCCARSRPGKTGACDRYANAPAR